MIHLRSLLPLLIGACGLLLVSCSSDRYADLPRTGFITHYQHTDNTRAPFASCWYAANSDKQWNDTVSGKTQQSFYFAPITLKYLYQDPKEPLTAKDMQGLQELCRYHDQTLRSKLEALAKDPNNHFKLAKQPGPGVYVVESAIIKAVPTKIDRNAAMTVAGKLTKLPLSTVLSGKDDKGSLAIATRIFDGQGHLIAEVADLRSGQSSVLGMATVELRDFQSFAHHRAIIDDWINESAQLLVTPGEHRVNQSMIHLW